MATRTFFEVQTELAALGIDLLREDRVIGGVRFRYKIIKNGNQARYETLDDVMASRPVQLAKNNKDDKMSDKPNPDRDAAEKTYDEFYNWSTAVWHHFKRRVIQHNGQEHIIVWQATANGSVRVIDTFNNNVLHEGNNAPDSLSKATAWYLDPFPKPALVKGWYSPTGKSNKMVRSELGNRVEISYTGELQNSGDVYVGMVENS